MFLRECERIIINKKFLATCVISIILFLLYSYDNVWQNIFGLSDLTDSGKKEILEFAKNKYNIWMQSYGYISTIFPILVVYPYLFSYVSEKENKFRYLVISRYGRRKYLINKFIVIALSGGLAIAIPEIIYYLLLTIIAENNILNPFTFYPRGIYANLFTNHPDAYIFIIIAIHFFIGVCYTAFALGISGYCKNKVSIYVIPFFIYLGVDIIISNINIIQNFSLLTTYNCMFSEGYTIVNFLGTTLILLAVGIGSYVIFEKRVLKNG